MEFRQIRQLVAIVESGSFRAAAARLNIAQPALSVSIQKLERAVGVSLLSRGARGVSLTNAGAAFLRDARQALALADQGRESARLAATGEMGTVRVGFVGSAVYRLLPKILPPFRARHDRVLLDLREGTTVELVKAVRDSQLDCAIVRGPLPPSPDLERFELERDRLVALLPADHALAARDRIDLALLAEEPFVLFSPRTVPGLHAAVNAACARAGFAPRAAQEVTQSVTMVGLVGSGMGVALSPGVIAAIAGSNVRFLPLTSSSAGDDLRLFAIKRHGYAAAPLRVFWSFIVN